MDYADQMLPFKLLFREINMVEFTNEDNNFIKSRLKDYAFTSFDHAVKTVKLIQLKWTISLE